MLCFQKLINCWQHFCPAVNQASQQPGQTSLDHSRLEEWFTKPFPERSSPLRQEINPISSVCMHVCVDTQYFTQLSIAVISAPSSLCRICLVWPCEELGCSMYLLWVLLLPTLFDLKYQGNDSEELHFPKLVVITPKTHSLHFTKHLFGTKF